MRGTQNPKQRAMNNQNTVSEKIKIQSHVSKTRPFKLQFDMQASQQKSQTVPAAQLTATMHMQILLALYEYLH